MTDTSASDKGRQVISIVFPTYKEAVRLPRTIREMTPFLRHELADYELIVVDDNSPDGTRDILFTAEGGLDDDVRARIRVFNQGGRFGKGAAVRRGFEEARGDIVMFMDADHSTRIEYLREALPQLASGKVQGVMGVRLVDPEEPMHRRIVSLGLLLLTHVIVFRKPVMDSQCGFKVFTRETARKLAQFCRVDTGLIDVEIFTLMQKWNSPYGYVSVIWNNDPDSRVEMIRTMLRDLRMMWTIRRNRTSGRYDRPLAAGERVWETAAPHSQMAPSH